MGGVEIHIRPVEADQRFAFVAENIDPQPWMWHVKSDHYNDYGYAAFRWTARLWAGMRARSFARRERMRDRTRKAANG